MLKSYLPNQHSKGCNINLFLFEVFFFGQVKMFSAPYCNYWNEYTASPNLGQYAFLKIILITADYSYNY